MMTEDPAQEIARALEALRMRLDASLTWPTERSWRAIAAAVGFPSAGATRRAAWRAFNHRAYRAGDDWFLINDLCELGRAVGLPPHARELRAALKALDAEKAPEDRDPPKPRQPRPLSKTALRRLVRERLAVERNTVEADPDPRALVPAPVPASVPAPAHRGYAQERQPGADLYAVGGPFPRPKRSRGSACGPRARIAQEK